VGVAYDEGNAREDGDFLGRALSVTAGYEDACGRISRMNLADSVASLGVSGGGNSAGVKDYNVGLGSVGSRNRALVAELPFDGRAVGLGCPATELFDKEGAHRGRMPEFYLNTRERGRAARLEEPRFTLE
jgi:hypothetical protein